jgi:antitoxin VapB
MSRPPPDRHSERRGRRSRLQRAGRGAGDTGLGNVLTSLHSASGLSCGPNEASVTHAPHRDRRSLGLSTADLTTVGTSPSSLPSMFIDDSTSSSTGGSAIFDERDGTISLNVCADQSDRPRNPSGGTPSGAADVPAEVGGLVFPSSRATYIPVEYHSRGPAMTSSTVFMSNRSQAVRLPKAVAFPEDVHQVDILKIGRSRVIVPKGTRWDDLFLSGPRVSEDFLSERIQPAAEEREPF